MTVLGHARVSPKRRPARRGLALHRPLPPLADGECQVWSNAVPAPTTRAAYLVAHTLTRAVLATHLGVDPEDVDIQHDCPQSAAAQGKQGLYFSLTHTDGLVALAVTRAGQVGVDVERVRALPEEAFAAAVLSEPERAALRNLPPGERNVAMAVWWTRKEAVLKATGSTAALSCLTVSPPDESPRLLATVLPVAPEDVHLTSLRPRGGLLGAVAVVAYERPEFVEIDAADHL